MQGLWKYANELIGKGLPLSVLGEFMMHFALQTLPLALPLAVLLSALLVIGRMAEDHEITASKASGISYLRLMRPLIFLSIFVGLSSFFFCRYVDSQVLSKGLPIEVRHWSKATGAIVQ